MSVIKSKRGESGMEFLATARKLRLYTVRKTKDFPKRLISTFTSRMINTAYQISDEVKLGNSIYPLNQEEAQVRRNHLMKAVGLCYVFSDYLDDAQELFGIDMKVMEEWAGLVSDEIRLVNALIKKDRERYKNLP
ncbi:MAG: hypothetical protein LUH03_10005 [Oscillospiraceae bacterium]|nr:hypothetical protein [Oscillospiraceae bacterium]